MPERDGSLVSVVIVNYQGFDDTVECLESLQGLDWPALEIVVVDNASGDGSAERLQARFPGAKVVALEVNLGFAGGCNRGAAVAKGDYVAFLNNDARPDRNWLRAAVDALRVDQSIGCVASKILDWEGQAVDFVEAALSFYGQGYKLHTGDPDDAAFDTGHDVLFGSGAAIVMPRRIFRTVGGFDDRYFMFFEDVDLGWRLWLFGYRVRYVPTSIVYHRHHRSMDRYGAWWEQYLLERNALFTIYKNYDSENLARMLPAALMLTVHRGVTMGGDDPHALDLSRGATDEDGDRTTIDKRTLATMYAVDALVENLPALTAARREIQSRRRRPDAEVVRLFRIPFHSNIGDPRFVRGLEAVLEALPVRDAFVERRRIVVATGDALAPAMAGPAIRAWQISRVLSQEHDVQLVTTTVCRDLSHPEFAIRKVDNADLEELVEWCDIVIFQGHLMYQHPCLQNTSKVVVADIYDPFHLEQLEQARDLGEQRRRMIVRLSTEVLNQQLIRGDFFLCASNKQRDFWLGQLAAVGRINPLTYDSDPNMDSLVGVVPFGVADDAPRHTRPVLRRVVPGIEPDDKIVLWGGGIYSWFDPLSLIRAIDKLRGRMPEVRLYFLGLKHPNPDVPEMRMAVEAIALSDRLGLTGSHVFFNDGWVDFDDRQNYLFEADLGVSTHLDHVETEFSFRTRILDYLWAGLPVVATDGDSFGQLIDRRGVGITVPAEDIDALEHALFRVLDDDVARAEFGRRSVELAKEFRWSQVLAPLTEFCRNPHRAPDLVEPEMAATISEKQFGLRPGVLRSLQIGARLLREGDLAGLTMRVRDRVRRALRGG
jgi:GT2 family glycosyltransferase